MDGRPVKIVDVFSNSIGKVIGIEFIDDAQRIEILGDGDRWQGRDTNISLEVDGFILNITRYDKFRTGCFGGPEIFHYGLIYSDADENNPFDEHYLKGREKWINDKIINK